MYGYFTMSFEGLVGLVVTVISVALIVKQLQQAHLASQMDGFLELTARFTELAPAIEFVDELGRSADWATKTNSESYEFLTSNKERRQYYRKIAIFYEGMAALVRRGALDQTLAYNTFGAIGTQRFNTFRQAIEENRKINQGP